MAIDYTKRPKPQDPTAQNPTWPPAATPRAPATANQPAPAGAPPQPRVHLSKVTLTKSAPSISLTKGTGPQGTMRVNLNWSARPQVGGFFSKLTGRGSVDLDLGCLYELADGTKSGIQALGNSFGALNSPPYIQLDADDRTGAAAGGENMHINFEQPNLFRRILIFAMIYEGTPNWAAVDGVVTLYPTSGPEVEVRLDAADKSARICAIALLENQGGEIVVRREVKYITGSQQAMDEAYGWGLEWKAGRK